MNAARLAGSLPALLLTLACPGLADEEPAEETRRREYDVSVLLEAPQVQQAPRLGLARWSYQAGVQGQPGVLSFDDEEVRDTAWFTPSELERWIEGVTGQGGELRQGRLIYELTDAAHGRVVAGLRQAREAVHPLAALTVEVVAIAPEQVRALRAGAGAALDRDALTALAQARRAGGRLAACQLLVRDGERAASAQLERTGFLGDREVNQTGIVPVLNPVLEELLAGLSVEVAAARLPGEEGRLILDAAVERVVRDPLLREVTLRQSGKLQLPAVVHLGLAASVSARAGETVLLGALQVPGLEERPDAAPRTLAVTCRLEAVPGARTGQAPAGPFLRRYALRAAVPAPERRFPHPAWPNDASGIGGGGGGTGDGGGGFVFVDEDEEDGPRDLWTPDRLADQVMSEAAQGTWEDPESGCWVDARAQALVVSQTAAGHAAVEAFLARESLAGLRVQHELLVLSAPESEDGAEVVPHVLDPAGWEKLLAAHPVEQRLLLAGQSGQRVEALLRREMRLVVEVESGCGGGAEGIATAEDPIVETFARGVHLGICARVDDEGALALDLDADLRQGGSLEAFQAPEGTFERLVGVEATRLQQRLQLVAGQALAWELGAGATRRILLLRSRPLR